MKASGYRAIAWCILLNALTIAIVAFFVVFYFFPHKIVFVGTGVAAASGIFWYVFNSFASYGKRIFGIADFYIGLLAAHVRAAVTVSLAVFLAAAGGTAIMFRTIVDRVEYLRALDRAIPFLEADQVGLPSPKDLAIAFALNPSRPEVPFILVRSARLLSFDDRYENFYLYMEQFLDSLDKAEVIKRGAGYRPQYKLAEAGDAPPLPLLDPIRLLAGYMVEVSKPRREKSYEAAIGLLTQYRDRAGDDAAKLQRAILEMEQALEIKPDPDPAKQGEVAKKTIERLDQQIDPSKRLQADPSAADVFRSVAFLADHIYQQALDQLAYLKATVLLDGLAHGSTCPVPEAPGNSDPAKKPEQVTRAEPAQPEKSSAAPDLTQINEVVAYYQRILAIRARLVSQSDVVWWQPPGKLTLSYIFAELSDKHGVNGAFLIEQFGKCPALLAGVKKLYNATAFKSFQDPETWMLGTPLSKSFNGSSSAAQLRKWMQMGWTWSF